MGVIGRKRTMMSLAVPFVLGWVLLLLPVPLGMSDSSSMAVILAGRFLTGSFFKYSKNIDIAFRYIEIFLTGLAGGAYPLISTIYITECVEVQSRGSFGMFMSIMITVGNLFVNCVGNFVGWVPMTGILIAFPSKKLEYLEGSVFCMDCHSFLSALMALLLIALPESPVFLLSKGRHEDAKKSLQFLRGAKCDVSDEMARIADNLRHQNKLGKVSAKQALVDAVYRWPLLIMMGLFLFRQLTGNMAVGYYLTEIFEEADTGLDPGLEATLVTLSQVLANFVTAGIVGEDTFKSEIS